MATTRARPKMGKRQQPHFGAAVERFQRIHAFDRSGWYRVFNILTAKSWMIRSLGGSHAKKAAISVGSGMPAPRTVDDIVSNLRRHGRPLASFHRGDRVRGATGMALRRGYSYVLEAEPGDLPADFRPDLSPAEMLILGVFEGKYLNDCTAEFPAEWFMGALAAGRLSPAGPDPVECNFFGVKSRQPLGVWRQNGWAPSRRPPAEDHYHGVLSHIASNPDERGWFQWYCRYWMGRRIPELDRIQIARWRAFRRHAGAIRVNCAAGNLSCRPRERQALLQWAYNPFI